MEVLSQHHTMTTTSQYRESPRSPEVIDLTDSDDDRSLISFNDDTDDLPSLRTILSNPSTRRNTVDVDIEDGTGQERGPHPEEATAPLPDDAGPPFTCQMTGVSQRQPAEVIRPRRESCEIPESPCDDRAAVDQSGSEAPVECAAQSPRDDLVDEYSSQQETLCRDSRTSTDLCSGMGRIPSCEDRVGHELGVSSSRSTDGRDYSDGILVDVSNTTFVSVYAERETSQGPEYACLVELWLRPEDGVPQEQIRDYKKETARCSRMQSLRKRRRSLDHHVADPSHAADMRALKKIRLYEVCDVRCCKCHFPREEYRLVHKPQ